MKNTFGTSLPSLPKENGECQSSYKWQLLKKKVDTTGWQGLKEPSCLKLFLGKENLAR